MKELLYFKDLCNGTTLITDFRKVHDFKIEVDTELLKRTLSKRNDIDKLATKLYRADRRDVSLKTIYREELRSKMRKEVKDRLKEIHPDTWENEAFILDSISYTFQKKKVASGYYFPLMALDYLELLDNFLRKNENSINELYVRQRLYLEKCKLKRRQDWLESAAIERGVYK